MTPARGKSPISLGWIAANLPTVIFVATTVVIIYLLGVATHLAIRTAADAGAVLEFIGSITGAAIGPGLAVIGSFWLEQRRRVEDTRHDRQIMVGALEHLRDAISVPPRTLLSDVSGTISARHELEHSRAIRRSLASANELLLLAKHGLRLGDIELLRSLSDLQRRMDTTEDSLRLMDNSGEDQTMLVTRLRSALDTARRDLLPAIFHAQSQLGA